MQQDPLPPPWVICKGDLIPFGISSWLCEDRQWPAQHTTFNFLLYIYLQDAKLCLLLAYVFESIEGSVFIFFKDILLDPTTETVGDSIISDAAMAFFGLVMAYSWLKIHKYNYRYLPHYFHRIEVSWLIYALEFLVLAAPTFFLFSFANEIGGIVPLMFILMIPWVAGWYLLFAYLNRNRIHWKKSVEEEGTKKRLLSSTVTFEAVKMDRRKAFWRFHLFTALFLVLYLSTYIYRYTHVFVMALFHNTAFLLILLIYWLANRNKYPKAGRMRV